MTEDKCINCLLQKKQFILTNLDFYLAAYDISEVEVFMTTYTEINFDFYKKGKKVIIFIRKISQM